MSLLLQHHLISPLFNVQETIIHSQQKSSNIAKAKMIKILKPINITPTLINSKDQTIQCNSRLDTNFNPNSYLLQQTQYTSKDEISLLSLKQGMTSKSKILNTEFKAKKIINTFSSNTLQQYLDHIDSLNSKKIKTQSSLKNFIQLLDQRSLLFKKPPLLIKTKISLPNITQRMSQDIPELEEVQMTSKKASLILNRSSQDGLKFIRLDKLNNQAMKQARMQRIYDLENAEQIHQLKSYIHSISKSLQQLKEYLNNSRKLYQVVKNMIGVKKNLLKIVIVQETESIIEPLTEENLSKGIHYKEQVYIKGDILNIEKCNFELIPNLLWLNEKCENLLLEIKMAALHHMEQNILTEHEDISKLTMKNKTGLKSLNENDLRYHCTGMRRFMINDQVENFESKLGDLQLISKESRKTNQSITGIIERMNQRDYI